VWCGTTKTHSEIVQTVNKLHLIGVFSLSLSLLRVLALLPNSPGTSQLSLETAAFFPFINPRLFLTPFCYMVPRSGPSS
jgi:hypothetical protein